MKMPHPVLTLLGLAATLMLGACLSNQPESVPPERKLEIYVEMAQGYEVLGEYERAKGQALKGLGIEADNEILLMVLGRCMLRSDVREEVGGAEQIFRRLLHDDDYRPHLGLAIALERKGQFFDQAARDIVRHEAVDADDDRDRERRLEAHRGSAHLAWEDAVGHFETVVSLHPGDRDALNGLARVHVLLGRSEQAIEWANMLLDTVWEELSFWRDQLQRTEISATDEARFRESKQDSVDLLVNTRLTLYTILVDQGRLEEAVEELAQVLEIEPDRAEVFSRRAQLRHQLGQYGGAIRDLNRFLELSTFNLSFEDPDIQQAYSLRAACEAAIRAGDARRKAETRTASAPR